MATRKSNFVHNPRELKEAMEITKLIKKSMFTLNKVYPISKKGFEEDINFIDGIIIKYFNLNKIILKINEEKISDSSIDIAIDFCDSNEKPITSATALQAERDFNDVFAIENIYKNLVIDHWKSFITKTDEINKNNKFNIIFKPFNNEDSLTKDIVTAELLTSSVIDKTKYNLGLVYEPDKNNFIAISSDETHTYVTNKKDSNTIFEIEEGSYISSDTTKGNRAVTKLAVPESFVSTSKHSEVWDEDINTNKYNEILLYAPMPKAVLLISNSSDLLIEEYKVAQKLSSYYKIPIKIINKRDFSLEKANTDESIMRQDASFLNKIYLFNQERTLDSFSQDPETSIKLLENYIKDVVNMANYSEEASSMIKAAINRMIDNIKTNYTGPKLAYLNERPNYNSGGIIL